MTSLSSKNVEQSPQTSLIFKSELKTYIFSLIIS